MAILDDTAIESDPPRFEIIRAVGRRRITHAFHDVDGTHSLIRDWPPVMSAVLHYAMTCGLADDFDSDENERALIGRIGAERLEETDRFCIESAGLSALTQMEWAIRRAVERDSLPPDLGLDLTDAGRESNAAIVRRIWEGEERFETADEPAALRAFIRERTPRLFQLYERVLNGASRDRNTTDARAHPERWRVPGSIAFVRHLHDIGCTNYFVTGAVIYEDGGMYEEARALGFEIGPGRMVEAIEGSAWDRKSPKDEVMRDLCASLGIDPRHVLVIGDGRSEIKAGVEMGGVAVSRLPLDATRQRELHTALGTNYIVPDFTDPCLRRLIAKGD